MTSHQRDEKSTKDQSQVIEIEDSDATITEEEWLESRKRNLPKGLHYVQQKDRRAGRYEFNIPRYMRRKYKTNWPEVCKIEALNEYKKFLIEYSSIKLRRSRRKKNRLRKQVLKREREYFESKTKRIRPFEPSSGSGTTTSSCTEDAYPTTESSNWLERNFSVPTTPSSIGTPTLDCV